MQILIKNGRVIDPVNNVDGIFDVLVEDSKISKLGKNIKDEAKLIIDATDKIILPGLVDMHVHLREPGREDKETLATGTMAAARGGVTTLLAMPNTSPAIDSPENVLLLKELIKKNAKVNVLICGTISKNRAGKELSDISGLCLAGAVAISDDGSSVDDQILMSEALKKAKAENILVSSHCEDKLLSGSGVVNRGFTATRLGLRGISKESEYLRIARDIGLAEKSGAAIHIAHVSCSESVEIIAQARKKGIRVTCEAAPHHFALNEEAVLGYDPNMKMNPPLRGKLDVKAIKDGLKNGVIDAIASDHAPHTENEKDIEFDRAEFGVIGLETELAVAITELVDTDILDWKGLVEKVSCNPAKILGIKKGALGVGNDADIVVVDPNREWLVRKEDFLSKSKNSAFIGKKLKGKIEYTFCNGEIVYQNGIHS